MNYSIIITTYNGRHLLEKHLPDVIKNSPDAQDIVVIDDGDDDSASLVAKFPKVTYVKNQTRLGFTKSTNKAVSLVNSDLVVLLNNDVSPRKGYLEASTKHFVDPQVFAVSFAEKDHSWPQVSWHDGKLQFSEGVDKSIPRSIAWPSGGSSIVRISHWKTLRGFNEVYSPGYWEDIDLGWRANKLGLKVIWEPKALVDHQHESTFKALDKNFLSNLKQRNELLFNWQNITDKDLYLNHLQFLVTYTVSHLGYAKVILSAMSKYLHIAKTRHHNHKQAKLSDKQVLSHINLPLK